MDFLCAFRKLSMSRDGWMKKKANASGDNGWAERVSVVHVSRHVWQKSYHCDDMLTLKRMIVDSVTD